MKSSILQFSDIDWTHSQRIQCIWYKYSLVNDWRSSIVKWFKWQKIVIMYYVTHYIVTLTHTNFDLPLPFIHLLIEEREREIRIKLVRYALNKQELDVFYFSYYMQRFVCLFIVHPQDWLDSVRSWRALSASEPILHGSCLAVIFLSFKTWRIKDKLTIYNLNGLKW